MIQPTFLLPKEILLLLLIVNTFTFAQVKPQENCGNIKTKSKINMIKSSQLNVLNTPLAVASINPITGFTETVIAKQMLTTEVCMLLLHWLLTRF